MIVNDEQLLLLGGAAIAVVVVAMEFKSTPSSTTVTVTDVSTVYSTVSVPVYSTVSTTVYSTVNVPVTSTVTVPVNNTVSVVVTPQYVPSVDESQFMSDSTINYYFTPYSLNPNYTVMTATVTATLPDGTFSYNLNIGTIPNSNTGNYQTTIAQQGQFGNAYGQYVAYINSLN